MMEEEEDRKFDSIGEKKEPLCDIIDLTAASTSPSPRPNMPMLPT